MNGFAHISSVIKRVHALTGKTLNVIRNTGHSRVRCVSQRGSALYDYVPVCIIKRRCDRWLWSMWGVLMKVLERYAVVRALFILYLY